MDKDKEILEELSALLEGVKSPWLTNGEACAYLKISSSTLLRMYNRGLIGRYRALEASEDAKRGWLYSKTELDEAINKNRSSVSIELQKHISHYGRTS